jgi:hypothetical protein
MGEKTYPIAVMIFLGMACLCLGSAEQAPAPVPPDVSITAPDPSLPERAKSILGKWVGKWNSRWDWDSALYVEKIDGDSAQVVFAWGEYTTANNTCHCNPNWVRVRKAKVTYSDNTVSLDFYTPALRPAWLKASHTVSGSSDEKWGGQSHSTGLYTYSFVVDKGEPGIMKGHFVSAKASHLRIEMKKVELGKDTDE